MKPKSPLPPSLSRWLTPGLRVKRWLLLMIFGMALMGLGIGYILVEWYRDAVLPPIFFYITLQFLPRVLRAFLFGGLGIFCLAYGFYRFYRSLLSSVTTHNDTPIVDMLWQQRIGSNGPKVVAIGGGHGLAALLRGIKKHTANITAIITVADDGGSSGRLRKEFGMLPPGDFRMCISALADDESLVTQLFQYRFGKSASGDSGLSGHSFGNLFIAAMAELTGSFEKALLESSKVVASTGRIVPSTLRDVILCAEFKANERVPSMDGIGPAVLVPQAKGESQIGKVGLPIERVWLEPGDSPAFPDAVRAILDADIVVLGPGSLFTSVMPNLLVSGITQALRETSAPVIYVGNVATERGETDHFTLDDHVNALERHIGQGIVDVVIANNHMTDFKPPAGVEIVQPVQTLAKSNALLLQAEVVDDKTPWRHDPVKLAGVVMKQVRR